MLGVILTILKIVGIILLIVLALILLLLICILFVPIRYNIEGANDEEDGARVKARITYLLHIFGVIVEYQGNLTVTVRIFGIKVFSFGGESEDEEKKVSEETEEIISLKTEEPAETEEKDRPQKTDEIKADNKKPDIKKDNKKQNSKKQDNKEKNSKEKGKIKEILSFIGSSDTKYCIHFLFEQILYIFKALKPKKCDIDMRFGFEDPSYTGWTVGAVSMTPWVYKKNVKIIPDFNTDKTYAYGTFKLKGAFAMITILIVVLRGLFDKTVRRFVLNVIKML
ncbi:MAG: hypothetical protein K6E13_08535 [Lachnospiraceae bacterium]|nr:hypothetical protein [Lachnospiraceae bacterium]